MSVLFEKIDLSRNAKVYIVNDKENYLQGPLTAESINKSENFITPPMPGEKIRVILIEPIEEKYQSNILISKVSHGIVDMFGVNNYEYKSLQSESCLGFGCSAPCNSNIICWPSLDLASKGIALILYQSEFSNDVLSYGSGVLLNNGKQDKKPIVLTPIHTYAGYMIEDLQFMFHYKSSSCNPTTQGPENIVAYGATALSNPNLTGNVDLRLLELNENPFTSPVFSNNPVSYLGWSIIDHPILSTLGIHHPRGDVQKYIAGGVPTKDNQTNNQYFAWRVTMQDGALQTLSSGSPLLDDQLRLIGANIGAYGLLEGACEETDGDGRYSRISMAWHEFQQYLDPDDEGIVAMNTITNQAGPKIFSEISGSDQLCSANSYTVLNSPLDATITWTATPSNLFSNSTGTGKIANLSPATASSSGTGTLTFTFTQNGESWYVSKNITVGSPKINMGTYSYNNNTQPTQPYFSIINNVVCDLYTPVSAEIPIEAGISNFHNLQILHVSDPSLTYYATFSDDLATIYFDFWDYGQEVIFRLTTQNDCGSDFKDFAFRSEQCYGYLSNYKVYPNPSSDVLNIEINRSENPESKYSKNGKIELKLFDASGNEVHSVVTSEKKTIIDVRKFKYGFYYLHIIHQEGIIRKQIRIEK
ncbi:T9SS type A sorting domain-containing protein [Belliella sp. R4-6]|uniref:T9SS type A sorting domain-containing protein n=1 Tax=Belliella alkalica TaxID=1730871 RepID=A0ABS9VGP3_9BACT|nr:T9SS type A sorting domain-containing protein [Belliella alkalica]MCH7415329.1 T9SS type A sorting domain-containing protein [Belliella alkalica]